jgi:hypothetical protein
MKATIEYENMNFFCDNNKTFLIDAECIDITGVSSALISCTGRAKF